MRALACCCSACVPQQPTRKRPLLATRPPTGQKQWVGVNEWQGLPRTKVALGVKSAELVAWVLDRMAR